MGVRKVVKMELRTQLFRKYVLISPNELEIRIQRPQINKSLYVRSL